MADVFDVVEFKDESDECNARKFMYDAALAEGNAYKVLLAAALCFNSMSESGKGSLCFYTGDSGLPEIPKLPGGVRNYFIFGGIKPVPLPCTCLFIAWVTAAGLLVGSVASFVAGGSVALVGAMLFITEIWRIGYDFQARNYKRAFSSLGGALLGVAAGVALFSLLLNPLTGGAFLTFLLFCSVITSCAGLGSATVRKFFHSDKLFDHAMPERKSEGPFLKDLQQRAEAIAKNSPSVCSSAYRAMQAVRFVLPPSEKAPVITIR